MKLTLLDMTQTILSALSSDEVNSISDTTESLQVAESIKTSYFNIISRTGLTKQEGVFQLDSSDVITQPVLMYKPDNVSRIEWIKYLDNTSLTQSPQYNYVTILPVDQFMDMNSTFNTNDTDVEAWSLVLNGRTYNLAYFTDRNPRYCCVLQNYYVLFDAYDLTVDDTLQSSKTMCFGELTPQWRMEDTFIPDLDEQQFPLLVSEAKALAFFELKQITHPKAEQAAKRQWSSIQKDKSVVNKPSAFDQLPNFGRMGYGGRYAKIIW